MRESRRVALSGTLKRFFADETGTYRGEVILSVAVTDAGGKVRSEGVASGGSERFGRSCPPPTS